MRKETISISDNIMADDNRIRYAIARIGSASDDTTLILRFDHNRSGVVQDVMNLINAIENGNDKIRYILVFNGYVVSAAAFPSGYFAFYNTQCQRVKVKSAGSVCMVYHKPRVSINNYEHFSSGLHPDKVYLRPLEAIKRITTIFDHVFTSVIISCRERNINIAPHVTPVYHINGDVCIVLKEGDL